MAIQKLAEARLAATEETAAYSTEDFTPDMNRVEDSVLTLINIVRKPNLVKYIDECMKEHPESKLKKLWKEFEKIVDSLDDKHEDILSELEKME